VKDAKDARLFLEGRTAELTESLKLRMRAAADAHQFEEAARWRDLIRTLEDIKQKPRTISVGLEDLDATGFARSGEAAALHVFFMRRGKIRDSREAFVEGVAGSPDGEVLATLLSEFYTAAEKPKRVLLPFGPAAGRRLQEDIFSGPGTRTRMIVPKAGKYAGLVELANRNAELALRKKEGDLSPVLHLARVLGMPEPPERIEGFDISNTGGDESVGSVVVFDGGVPNKDEYRQFRIRTVVGPNDVAALGEIVRRRYVRLKEEGRSLPGLILVDGGKGQLSAAVKALAWAGTGIIPVVSLAKREEIIFTPKHPEGIRLDGTAPALKLLQRVRDEAHRFAITFHRKRREKKSFGSELDGIPGLGPKRKAALLERIGGLEAILSASFADLAAVVGEKTALTLISALRK
jgi:excinuclease ABC subunit C